ncbi:hypothetical protein [Nitrosopumilus sp.]|uniref:hypothetical protein n=1 Tax=Nitrosopumilus sp. TaxID=2024843 RepID=UPI0034A5C801
MKTRLLIIIMIVFGIIISGITVYLFDQMYDCLYPPLWMKTPRSSFNHCWELFLNGHLPDWSDAREDYAKKQAHKLESIERYKDKPEVVAFYAKYDDANVSVQDAHVSYFAGNDDDFHVRMNLYFDGSYDLTHMRFYCWIGDKLQHEVAQEDILSYLKNPYCMTLSEENKK